MKNKNYIYKSLFYCILCGTILGIADRLFFTKIKPIPAFWAIYYLIATIVLYFKNSFEKIKRTITSTTVFTSSPGQEFTYSNMGKYIDTKGGDEHCYIPKSSICYLWKNLIFHFLSPIIYIFVSGNYDMLLINIIFLITIAPHTTFEFLNKEKGFFFVTPQFTIWLKNKKDIKKLENGIFPS